jgi:hypothetical protein
MMKDHEFCDSCPGCRPAMMSLDGKRVPDDDPMMIKVMSIWENETSYAQRRAYIEENARDRQLCMQVMHKIQQALGE